MLPAFKDILYRISLWNSPAFGELCRGKLNSVLTITRPVEGRVKDFA